ncbi:universal stress protein [Legionella gresilensis]|uniref:universal stress protein n=1 Tax=Legionella gresilensis TaxID=91823 RepID=UPI001041088D|nr:universal stress protein [Legionella gresilensis]
MTYKKIMLAVDGSEIGQVAVKEIIKIAQNKDVTVRLVYIVDETFIYQGSTIDYGALVSAYREEGQKILDDIEKLIISQSSIKVEKTIVELKKIQVRIAELIMKEAQKWPADLLVIGTHGRRGFNRFFLGSVAENIIRIATVPVLLVRDPR